MDQKDILQLPQMLKASTVRSKEILPFTNRQFLNRTLLGHAAPTRWNNSRRKKTRSI